MYDSPTELNRVLRLALIAENHGSHFLDNLESFNRMFGRSGRAKLEGPSLSDIRRIVKTLSDSKA